MAENILLNAVIVVISLIVAVVALKIVISINWVEFLKYRRRIQLGKLQNLCPHVTLKPLETSNEYAAMESLFCCIPGTFSYKCRQCKFVVDHIEDVEEIGRRWANHLEELMKREDRFRREVRKFYKM